MDCERCSFARLHIFSNSAWTHSLSNSNSIVLITIRDSQLEYAVSIQMQLEHEQFKPSIFLLCAVGICSYDCWWFFMLGNECNFNMPYGEETAEKLAADSCRFDAQPWGLDFLCCCLVFVDVSKQNFEPNKQKSTNSWWPWGLGFSLLFLFFVDFYLCLPGFGVNQKTKNKKQHIKPNKPRVIILGGLGDWDLFGFCLISLYVFPVDLNTFQHYFDQCKAIAVNADALSRNCQWLQKSKWLGLCRCAWQKCWNTYVSMMK